MDELVEVQFKPVKGSNAIGTLWWIMRTIRIGFRILLWICILVFAYTVAPIIKGNVEMDNPMTTSQITAMIGLIAVLYMARKV